MVARYTVRNVPHGVETLSDFAFVTSYTLGSADITVFDKDVVTPAPEDTPNPRTRLNLRKLHTEAFTMYAANMKRKVLHPDNDDKPRQLAPPERKSRMELLKKELNGLNISGDLDVEKRSSPHFRMFRTHQERARAARCEKRRALVSNQRWGPHADGWLRFRPDARRSS